jgi:hypothetical protein
VQGDNRAQTASFIYSQLRQFKVEARDKSFGALSISSEGWRQTVIMKRPYRDILAWLADIRPPNEDSSAERAIAAVIEMLARYDRDPRLAARWEERFLNGRRNSFPFGMNTTHQKILRVYLIK